MGNQKRTSSLLPYSVIVAASNGDVEAINTVLKHYEGYIISLSSKWLYDDNSTPHLFIDETIKRRLETKLITKILTFQVT